MSFWSGERLAAELPHLIDPFKPENLDCASYKLRVGPEAYVTPSDSKGDWSKRTKTLLANDAQDCVIPPGQFAFILTEESVRVPPNAIGFISMRSYTKFRGLVNVSGFHVDPGYQGRLIFSVFNAGPSDIHFSRGEPLFVIFYAELDQTSQKVRDKPGYNNIPSELINPVAGEVWSFAALNSHIEEVQTKLSERMNVVERESAISRWASALLVGALLALGLKTCSLNDATPAERPPANGIPSSAPSSTTP